MNVIVNWHVGWHSKPKMTAHKLYWQNKSSTILSANQFGQIIFQTIIRYFFFLIKVKAGSCYKYQYTGKHGADKS